MKHTEKLNMQASASFVIIVGTSIVNMTGIECFESSLSVIIEATSYHVKM